MGAVNSPDGLLLAKLSRGVSAVVHNAFVMSFEKDPSKVIPITVARVTAVLKANAKEKSVKRFAYMSSSVITTLPKPGMKFHIDWNKESIEAASGPLTKGVGSGRTMAPPTESENAIWRTSHVQLDSRSIMAKIWKR
jgi:hypothetical protein